MKLLNFIEFAYNENKISKAEFESHLAEKLSKINDLRSKISNFNLEKFINVKIGLTVIDFCRTMTSQTRLG